MTVWDDVVGQSQTVRALSFAARDPAGSRFHKDASTTSPPTPPR